ncbi:hypothetical protein PV458_47335 [Streptomyces sp. MN03-5084-2B]|nr:hypothetical protein [Streptomyces sp. MN03-5084-2B]
MDENYARKLRNWLRAEPGGTPGGTAEEREWLREIPAPASDEPADTPDRWTVRGQLPQTPADDDDRICPVIALPVPRTSGENGCRTSGLEVRIRWGRPANADRSTEVRNASPISDAEARSRWAHPTNADRRAQASAPSPVTDAEARTRWSQPADADRRAQASAPSPMTDAEARSRWSQPADADRRGQASAPNPTTGADARRTPALSLIPISETTARTTHA